MRMLASLTLCLMVAVQSGAAEQSDWTVQGTVLSSAGEKSPLSGVKVAIRGLISLKRDSPHDPKSGPYPFESDARSDPDGVFCFRLPASIEECALFLCDERYVIDRPLLLSRATTTDALELTAWPAVYLDGHVLDGATGAPLSGTSVEAVLKYAPSAEFRAPLVDGLAWDSVITRPEGAFRLQVRGFGTVQLSCSDSRYAGYVEEFSVSHGDADMSRAIRLGRGFEIRARIEAPAELADASSLSVELKSPSLEKKWGYLRRLTQTFEVLWTPKTGEVRAPRLGLPGEYQLWVQDASKTLETPLIHTLTVEEGADVCDLGVIKIPRGRIIHGQVIGMKGAIDPSAFTVDVKRGRGPPSYYIYPSELDEHGAYRVTGLPAGEYRVVVYDRATKGIVGLEKVTLHPLEREVKLDVTIRR